MQKETKSFFVQGSKTQVKNNYIIQQIEIVSPSLKQCPHHYSTGYCTCVSQRILTYDRDLKSESLFLAEIEIFSRTFMIFTVLERFRELSGC